MTIKHLVIAGGGPTIFQSLGVIQTLEMHKYINISDIESIYGSSAGAIIGLLISLNYDQETLYDFMIKRPWKDVFNIKIDKILDAYSKKGVFDEKTIEKCFKSAFDAKNVPLDITLETYHQNFSQIELHFFTFDINNFALEDISYLTHPSLQLLTAVKMSCGLPILVCPTFIEDKCYIDGGIVCNYPLKYCLGSGKNESEILGLKNEYNKTKICIDHQSTLLEYILNFLYKLIQNMNADNNTTLSITNEICLEANLMTLDSLTSSVNDIETRKKLFKKGEDIATEFVKNVNK
jgi:predicted acylesterase/phospholipase RssA